MKESAKMPSPVVIEIAKRRLASNRLLKRPAMPRPCLSKDKVREITGICTGKEPSPQVSRQVTQVGFYQIGRKDVILPEISSIKNPFSLIPKRDRFFSKEKNTRKAKRSNFDIGPLKTVIDNIHHEYFSVIDGRPIRPNHDIKLYMRNLRDIFIFSANTAYLNDQSLKIETLYKSLEREEYDKIYLLYRKTVVNFQKCLYSSFNMAQHALMKQREVEIKIKVQNAELEKYLFEYGRLRNLVLPLIDKFDVLLKYKKFLEKCAPLWWRLQNNIGFTGTSKTFKTFFLDSDEEIVQRAENDEFAFKKLESDESLFEKPKVILVNDPECLLYFSEPKQIMNLLEDMAEYGFRYIQVGMQYSSAMKPVSEYRNYLKAQLALEIQSFGFDIKRMGEQIKYLEDKTEYVKAKFFRILNNEFKHTISSYDNLKLFVCLQYINTETLGIISDPEDTLSVLMSQIERKYEDLMLRLDAFDYKLVKHVVAKCMRDDREVMKRAYEAQRVVREWNVFEKALRASFEPPRYKYKKNL